MQQIDANAVKPIMAMIGSRKRKAYLSVCTHVTLSGTYWSGGSRDSYTAIDLATMRKVPAPQYNPPQFGGPSDAPRVELPQGVIIVQHGTFQGKPSTPMIYIRPENMARLLPAPC